MKLDLNTIEKGHVQKIYACPFFYSFKIRVPGETIFLYVGKGRHSRGVYLSKKIIQSEHRRKDSYLEKLRKELLGARIKSSEIISEGILRLSFYRAEREILLLISYRNNLLFSDLMYPLRENHIEHYAIYMKKPFQKYDAQSFDLKKIIKDQLSKLPPPKKIKILELDEPDSLIKSIEKRSIKKVKTKVDKKRSKIEDDIKRLRAFIEFKNNLINHAELENYIQNNTFEFQRIKLKNFPENYYQGRDLIFKKIKNVEKAISIQEVRLKQLNNPTEEESFTVDYVFPAKNLIDLSSEKKTNIYSPKKLSFGLYLVGKNARENNEIKSNWSRADDYWFHLKDGSSAHFFLRLKDGLTITPNILDEVCRLMRRDEELQITIIYTQVKYLKPVKGSPGKFRVKMEKEYTKYFFGV